jgi:anti-sigma28 factor (negative regulator of flagellin synthesis)
MRISSDALEGALAQQTSRAQEAARTYGSQPRGSATVTASGDSVRISGLSTRIMEASSAHEASMSDRISTLAAQYARGEYSVDSATLSHALVSHALGGAVDGEA